MKYPMINKYDPFLGDIVREMTAQEYEEQLLWYRDYIKTNISSESRKVQDYVSYLESWFSNNECDGLLNFETRYTFHTLPMPFNIYIYG